MDYKEMNDKICSWCREHNLYVKNFSIDSDPYAVEFRIECETNVCDDVNITIKNPQNLDDVLLRLYTIFGDTK